MAREVYNDSSFQDKIVKLIPTEIVGAYLVVFSIIAPADAVINAGSRAGEYSLVFAFIFLLVLTPIYLWRVSGVVNIVQLSISTVSYVIWIYTLTYPFKYWNWYYPQVGAVALVLWSLITLFFVTAAPPQPALPPPSSAGSEENTPAMNAGVVNS